LVNTFNPSRPLMFYTCACPECVYNIFPWLVSESVWNMRIVNNVAWLSVIAAVFLSQSAIAGTSTPGSGSSGGNNCLCTYVYSQSSISPAAATCTILCTNLWGMTLAQTSEGMGGVSSDLEDDEATLATCQNNVDILTNPLKPLYKCDMVRLFPIIPAAI